MPTQMMFNPVFGRYLLMKRIAKGGMAEIFRAISHGAEGFKKLVAIKRILPELSRDAQFVDMFINEAKIVASLNHPNIVQIYDFGNIDGLLYHSMEYVHGKNMSEIIMEMQDLPPKTAIEPACYIVLEALSGLDQAHRQTDNLGKPLHIMHRDMSPSNIIVSYDGEVKIADFGIAKATQTTVHTVGGMVKGKFRYLSPEQARGQPLDQRTDIFSLGICMYEMLTLSDMFSDVSGLLMLEKVRDADFTPPRKRNPAIPKRLESLLLRALHPDRDKRYPTAAAWRDDLIKYLGGNKMHLARSWLADFMTSLFGTVMQLEREQLAKEDQLADELCMGEGQIAQAEVESTTALKTMLIDVASHHEQQKGEPAEEPPSLDDGSYGEDEDSRDETIRLNLQQLAARAKARGISLDDDEELETTDQNSQRLSLDADEDDVRTVEVDGLQSVPDLANALSTYPTPKAMPRFADGTTEEKEVPKGALVGQPPARRLVPGAVPEKVSTERDGQPLAAERPLDKARTQLDGQPLGTQSPRKEPAPRPAPAPQSSSTGRLPRPRFAPPDRAPDRLPPAPLIPGTPVQQPRDKIDRAAAALDAPKQRSPWLYVILGFLAAVVSLGILVVLFGRG